MVILSAEQDIIAHKHINKVFDYLGSIDPEDLLAQDIQTIINKSGLSGVYDSSDIFLEHLQQMIERKFSILLRDKKNV